MFWFILFIVILSIICFTIYYWEDKIVYKRIRLNSFLTNICYFDKVNNKKVFTFVKVKLSNEVNDYLFNNINKNNEIQSIPKNSVLGTLYNPKIYSDLNNVIQKYSLSNQSITFYLEESISAPIQYEGDDLKVNHGIINFNKIIFLKNELYIIDVNNTYIPINYINKIFIGVDDNVLNSIESILKYLLGLPFKYTKGKDYVLLPKDELKVLFDFYQDIEYLSDYSNLYKASKFFFINPNYVENKDLALKNITSINIINTHIEFFVFMKYLLQFNNNNKIDDKIHDIIVHYIYSLFPNSHISEESMIYAFESLDINTLIHRKKRHKDSHLNSYIFNKLINNINDKYPEELINDFLSVLSMIVDYGHPSYFLLDELKSKLNQNSED